MILRLEREPTFDGTTLGDLFVNGLWTCFTLEDAVRDGEKIAHETAIPAGRYPVTITKSLRFGRMLPLIEGVSGFEGIRIHPGNTKADTSGCILVGLAKNISTRQIESSRAALDFLQPQIAHAIAAGEDVRLDVVNASVDALLRV